MSSGTYGASLYGTGGYTSGLYAAIYINASPFRLHQVVGAFTETDTPVDLAGI